MTAHPGQLREHIIRPTPKELGFGGRNVSMQRKKQRAVNMKHFQPSEFSCNCGCGGGHSDNVRR